MHLSHMVKFCRKHAFPTRTRESQVMRSYHLFVQAAQVNTIAGQPDPGCTTADGTNSNAAPFPGKAQACTSPGLHT